MLETKVSLFNRRNLFSFFSVIAVMFILTAVSLPPIAKADRSSPDRNALAPCVQENFVQAPTFNTTALPVTVVSEDFDGDGKIDLAAGGANVSVLRNTGAAGTIAFDPAISLSSGSSPSSIAAADLDNDGKKDIVISINALSVLYIYRNTSAGPGSISFAPKIDVAVTSQPSDLVAADLDGDGKIDLAVSNNAAATVTVLKNISPAPGTISFAAPNDFAVAPQPRSLAVGDLDGDAKIDIAAVSYSNGAISVLRNTSSGGTIQFNWTEAGGAEMAPPIPPR